MNYELAKELKDAGFPKRGDWVVEDDGSLRECLRNMEISLSELIEACPATRPDYMGLTLLTGLAEPGWLAGYSWHEIWDDVVGRGATLEEAVARLWVALHSERL